MQHGTIHSEYKMYLPETIQHAHFSKEKRMKVRLDVWLPQWNIMLGFENPRELFVSSLETIKSSSKTNFK